MERIERKTNEQVFRTVKEQGVDKWLDLRHPEELRNIIIIVGMAERKRTAGRPRNSYIGQIKSDARVKTFKELKEKARNRLEWTIKKIK